VLGYVDDLVIVPLGVWATLRLIPKDVLAEYRAIASAAAERPISRVAAALVLSTWVILTCGALLWFAGRWWS
jgi:uncharacterized membrane protein YkvA (DUF1232 family)